MILLAGWLAACGLAFPVMEDRGVPQVDAQLLSTFALMEQYALAAYCPTNYNSPGDKVSCSSKNCPLVQSANTITLAEFNSDLATDVTGFVAADDTNRLIVISFRGSHSLDNWITNLQLDLIKTDLCPGCTAHHGFWQSWLDSRKAVLDAIKGSANTRPGYKIVATGHSLGGAIASIAAAQLRNGGYDVALYTFGAPRIAGSKLSDYISGQKGGNYRITHWNDPIPRLPPLTMGYVHITPEYYINKADTRGIKPKDIKIYEGSINLRGNAAWLVTDIGAHLFYFGSITECSR